VKIKQFVSLIVVIAFISACAPKDLPPELQPSYKRLEVLKRVDELQKLTIALYDSQPRQISKGRADLIVKFTIVAADVTANTVDGWQATVKSAWFQLNKQLLIPDEGLDTIWKIVDALIQAL